MEYLPIISIFYGLLFIILYISVLDQPLHADFKKNSSVISKVTGAWLLLLCLVQLITTGFMPGHLQDTALFRAWTAFANDHPVWEYYKTDLYVDYPPVYLYVLYLVGCLTKLLGIHPNSGLYLIFVRSIPIFFDGLTSFCIFKFSKQYIGEKKALALAVLSAVNPVNILNSTAWGQVDSVTGFMTAAMLILLYKKKYVASCSMLALLFLTKPQMIIFSPLMGFVFFFDLIAAWKEPKERMDLLKQVGLSVLAVVAVLLIVPLPITGGDYMLLLNNYAKALNLYPYATLNAANFYGALGANWAKDSNFLLFLSFKTWGFLFIVAISVMVGVVSFKSRDRRKIFYLGTFTVLGIYMLAHGMHERYMQPMFLLMIITYVLAQDHKAILFYGAFSVTTFMSCGMVLYLNQRNDFIYGDNNYFILLSWTHVVLFVLWMVHSIKFYKKNIHTLSKN